MATASDSNTNHAMLFQLRLISPSRLSSVQGIGLGLEGLLPRVSPMSGVRQTLATNPLFCLTRGRASNPLELFIQLFLGKNQPTGPTVRAMMGVTA